MLQVELIFTSILSRHKDILTVRLITYGCNLGEGFFLMRRMSGFMRQGRCYLEIQPRVENTIILFKLFKVLRKLG